MELVGSGFDGDADDAAEVVAIGGWRVLGDEVELLDGVDAGGEGYVVVVDLVVIHAIEDVVVGLLAVAVDVGASDLEARLRAGKGAGVQSDGAGREQGELVVVACGKGQSDIGASVENCAKVAVIGLEERRCACDFDGLRGLSNGQRNVDSCGLLLVEREGWTLCRGESLGCDLERVLTYREGGKIVGAGGAGSGVIGGASGDLAGCDLRACDDGA